jgi:hypothetical protein
MNNYFKNLVAAYNQVEDADVKSFLYGAMVQYASDYHVDYSNYDMDMYVELYKCASTQGQRKYALKRMRDIAIDNSFQSLDEIIQNFKEFTLMKDYLDDQDVQEFDEICKEVLDFFKSMFAESLFEANAGQADFIPRILVYEAKDNLMRVIGLILDTQMENLESYALALASQC